MVHYDIDFNGVRCFSCCLCCCCCILVATFYFLFTHCYWRIKRYHRLVPSVLVVVSTITRIESIDTHRKGPSNDACHFLSCFSYRQTHTHTLLLIVLVVYLTFFFFQYQWLSFVPVCLFHFRLLRHRKDKTCATFVVCIHKLLKSLLLLCID